MAKTSSSRLSRTTLYEKVSRRGFCVNVAAGVVATVPGLSAHSEPLKKRTRLKKDQQISKGVSSEIKSAD